MNHRSCDLGCTAAVSVTSNYYRENFLALMVLWSLSQCAYIYHRSRVSNITSSMAEKQQTGTHLIFFHILCFIFVYLQSSHHFLDCMIQDVFNLKEMLVFLITKAEDKQMKTAILKKKKLKKENQIEEK